VKITGSRRLLRIINAITAMQSGFDKIQGGRKKESERVRVREKMR